MESKGFFVLATFMLEGQDGVIERLVSNTYDSVHQAQRLARRFRRRAALRLKRVVIATIEVVDASVNAVVSRESVEGNKL
jgi:hypothetical protein